MKRQRATGDELKQEINKIIADTKVLGVEAKLRAIFTLENGDLQSVAWRDVKNDRQFWLGVIKALDLVNYEAVTETGNQQFGYPEMTEILGQKITGDMISGTNIAGLPETDQATMAKKQFMSYMSWYDSDAKFHFLVVYGYYRRLIGELVDYARTQEHTPVCTAINIAEKPIITQDVTETYYVASIFKLMVTYGPPHIYFFYMTKQADTVFVIKQGRDKTHNIPTNGPITSVLKFYEAGVFYIVISGERDDKLLRFKQGDINNVTLIDHFRVDANTFDDVSYGSMSQFSYFPTNTKSTTNLRDLQLVTIPQLKNMNPQPIRSIADLTSKEKRLFVSTQSSINANRKVTAQEAIIVRDFRIKEKKQSPTVLTNMSMLSDLSIEELRAITEQTGHVYVQTEYQYGKLFSTLKEDIRMPKFVEKATEQGGALADKDYVEGNMRCMAVKVIRLPSRASTAPESKYYTYVAMLTRRYTKNVGDYETVLYIVLYDMTKPKSFTSVVLPSFMHRNNARTTYTVAELNIVFHTSSLFYVEVQEKVVDLDVDVDAYGFVNSQLVSYDFQFDERSPPVLFVESEKEREMMMTIKGSNVLIKDEDERAALVKDGALFEEVRKANYKVYDYRHDIDPSRTSKYDCIFYRYNVFKSSGRLIFYKTGTERPSIADVYIDGLNPRSTKSIMPIVSASSRDLCLLNMEQLVLESYETLGGQLAFKRYGLPQIIKLTAVEQTLPAYDKATYSLSTKLQQSLTISASSSHCIFCGQPDGVKDTLTNYHYCGKLCQRLFCTTNRW